MKVLLSKEELHDGVRRWRRSGAFEGRQLTIVGVLTGSVVLVADLIRHIDQPMRVGVIQASSYRGATTTRGDLIINSELMLDISGRDVLLVDDIFDTGHTLPRGSKSCTTSSREACVRRCCFESRDGRRLNTGPTSRRETAGRLRRVSHHRDWRLQWRQSRGRPRPRPPRRPRVRRMA